MSQEESKAFEMPLEGPNIHLSQLSQDSNEIPEPEEEDKKEPALGNQLEQYCQKVRSELADEESKL